MKSGNWLDRHGSFAFLCLVLLLLLIGAYENHFDNGFHFDDSHVIVDNLSIRSLRNTPQFFTDAQTFTSLATNAVYRPLLTLSYALDYWRAGGLVPAVFHRTQFALLLVVGILLVGLFRRLFDLGRKSPWNRYSALFASALFCVHTANTETVNYLSSRSSLVATLALVASMLAYLAWPDGRRTYLYLLPALVGGLAKPLTVMFAPILFVFILFFEEDCSVEMLRHRDGWARVASALKRSLPSFVILGALFVFLSRMNAETLEYSVVSRWDYAMTQPFVWVHYVRLFFLPIGLTADTDWKWASHWYDTRLFVGLLFVAGLAVAIGWLSRTRKHRPAAFGLAWFCLTLLPTSSIIPLSEVYNEHRIFLPYVGLSMAVCWVGFLALRRLPYGTAGPARLTGRIVALALFGILVAHAVGTHARNRVWKNGEALWRDVVEKSPTNGRGLMNYGLALMRKGESQLALDYFDRASVYTPAYAHLEINLGVVKTALGRDDEAEAHYLRAIRLSKDYAGAHSFYAIWLANHERGYEAIEQLEQALAISPNDARSRDLLLRLYVAAGHEEKFSGLARETRGLVPDDPRARAYASGRTPFEAAGESAEDFLALGRHRVDQAAWLDAAAILRHALTLDEESAVAWNNLGWARMNLGFPDLAVPCFRRAFELDPAMLVARNNLTEARRRTDLLRQQGRLPAGR